uniref:Uncharacterized protein n=1 Tax=Malurus cyaneus samueli TaxID=2593467 RepID=A0A8C5TZQ2_9PASS
PGAVVSTQKNEQPPLSQPVFIGELLQLSDYLHVPPLDLLQQVHVFNVGGPELDAGRIGLLIHQHPQVLLFLQGCSQSILCSVCVWDCPNPHAGACA